MNIKTDSVNDILCHYGITPGTAREYINGIIAHSYRSEREALIKQRNAYDQLSKALVEKADKLLDELESADKSLAEIIATIKDKTREDKNYNAKGLEQRKKTYLLRRNAANAELDKVIKEVVEIRNKMWKEIGYTFAEYAAKGDPDFDINHELRRIDNRRNLLLRIRRPLNE